MGKRLFKNCVFFLYLSIEYFKLTAAYFFSIFIRVTKPIWLISERGTDARDNGFFFFCYLQNNHPEIDVRYVISKDSVDKKRFSNIKRLVEYKSFRHYIYFNKADVLISTHIQGYSPSPELTNRLNSKLNYYRKKKQISLKHGITKDYIPTLEYSNTKLDLLCCGAIPELNYMLSTYGYPDGVLQYTGFCRFDNLNNFVTKKQILVMPTWRRWLNNENFKSSNYCSKYIELLTDSRLINFLEVYNIELVFYPHHEIQPFIGLFEDSVKSKKIIIAEKAYYDVQQLLKESMVLITDYSSVLFDFAYMNKPMIYYQFDEKEYRTAHYKEGYFDYRKSFGPVFNTIDLLINYLTKNVNTMYSIEPEYMENIKSYFPVRDEHNCDRVFESIKNIKK